jgi:hypothetical protein
MPKLDDDESELSLRSRFPKAIIDSLLTGDQENFGRNFFGFETVLNSSTLNSSFNWFGNCGLVSNLDDKSEFNEHINNTEKMFNNATRISWSESKIGVDFRKKLKRFEDSLSLALYSPSIKQSDFLWACNTPLRNGYPFMQMGEVWRDNTDQSEFIYWHTEAIVRTRYPRNAPELDLALSLHIPNLFQSAMYLGESAENQLRDTNAQRSEVFSVNKTHNIPRIAMHIENDCFIFGLKFVEDHYEPKFMWAPQSIRLGYIFEANHIELELQSQFESIINSMPGIGEILADGFCNFSERAEGDFQSICHSDRFLSSSSSTPVMQSGDFVPGCLYAHLNYLSEDCFESSHSILKQALDVNDLKEIKVGLNGLQNVMNDGCGPTFMSAANSLFYIQLTELSEDQRVTNWIPDAKVYLKYVSEVSFGYENANALSNLCGINILEGDLETALENATRGRSLLIDAPYYYSVVMLELMGYQLKAYRGLGLNLEATNTAEEIISWVRGRTFVDQQEVAIDAEARATLSSSPTHQSLTLKMLSNLGRDARDGTTFDLRSHLERSVQRGSKLARVQLDTVNYFLHNSAARFDKEVRDELQLWEGQFKDLFSELELDLDDFVLSDEFEELVEELTEHWAEFSDLPVGYSIYPETFAYIFENLRKSKIELGPFGTQGDNSGDYYRITHHAENLVLSPVIPRSLLWDISVGKFANDLSFFMGGNWGGGHLDSLPAYLVGICASPIASINLLKTINEIDPDSSELSGFAYYVKNWVQFPLLVNPVSDIWLLATLEPANIANSFFNSHFGVQDMGSTDSLSGGVLAGCNHDFLSNGTLEIFKLSQELSFSEDLFAIALLAQRIIEEFKSERARISDHLDSLSEIVRAVIFSNPKLEKTATEKIDRHEAIFENKNLLELITLLWNRDDLSVVI